MPYTRSQGWELLKRYNQDPFHLRHAVTVEAVMGWFARELGYGEEEPFWRMVGLLHDLDFEQYPEQHCLKSQEIMEREGLDPRLIRDMSGGVFVVPRRARPSFSSGVVRASASSVCRQTAPARVETGRCPAPRE